MRKLYIGTHLLRFIAGSKDKIDALAFAVLIKEERINSVITDATQRKLKNLFGIGSDKLKKVVSDGIKWGFLRKEGNRLIANRLHEGKELCYLLRRMSLYKARKNKRLTISGVRRLLQEAIVYNQIAMQEDCADTHNRASGGGRVAAIRKAIRRERRMLRGVSYNANFHGLSNTRIQQLIGRKRGSAIKVVKSAVSKELLSKTWRIQWTSLNGDPCNAFTKDAVEAMGIIVAVRKRTAFVRHSNAYKTIKKNLKFTNHGR